MQIQRITSLLQGVSDVRNWIVAHIPLTSSMVGYDLFLKLGNDYLLGQALDLRRVYAQLPYSAKTIRRQVAKFEQAELIGLVANDPHHHPHVIVPTARFVSLLTQYQQKFESLFIVRKSLRDKQLAVVVDKPELAHFATSLYDQFYDLGFLYAHTYGNMCFVMALLVQRVALAYGHEARFASCYVDIRASKRRFLLGGQGFAAPGQIEGHAVCIIDDSMLLDFGLGNARRFRADFPWGIACQYQPSEGLLGGVEFDEHQSAIWKTDWQYPETAAEVLRLEPLVERLFQQYKNYYL